MQILPGSTAHPILTYFWLCTVVFLTSKPIASYLIFQVLWLQGYRVLDFKSFNPKGHWVHLISDGLTSGSLGALNSGNYYQMAWVPDDDDRSLQNGGETPSVRSSNQNTDDQGRVGIVPSLLARNATGARSASTHYSLCLFIINPKHTISVCSQAANLGGGEECLFLKVFNRTCYINIFMSIDTGWPLDSYVYPISC